MLTSKASLSFNIVFNYIKILLMFIVFIYIIILALFLIIYHKYYQKKYFPINFIINNDNIKLSFMDININNFSKISQNPKYTPHKIKFQLAPCQSPVHNHTITMFLY